MYTIQDEKDIIIFLFGLLVNGVTLFWVGLFNYLVVSMGFWIGYAINSLDETSLRELVDITIESLLWVTTIIYVLYLIFKERKTYEKLN